MRELKRRSRTADQELQVHIYVLVLLEFGSRYDGAMFADISDLSFQQDPSPIHVFRFGNVDRAAS